MNESSALSVGKINPFEEERVHLRQQFLMLHGLETQSFTALPSDASFRRYFRCPKGIIMDAPPPEENTKAFQQVAEVLENAGLSVPRIFAADHEKGFMWLEDLGILSYRKAMAEGISEKVLYGETVQALAHLHKQMSVNTKAIPSYDLSVFLEKVCLFVDWIDFPFVEEDKITFKELWKEAYLHQPELPKSLLLRDVMVDNLIWLPSRQGYKRSGFLDFQDALWGPVSYDLVSLLEDARRDISPEFAQEMVEIYFKNSPELSRDDFWASYSLWGAQRTARILGIFYRLAKRDGKEQYLSHLPRLWDILRRDLEHPQLTELNHWFQMVMP